MRRRFLLPAAAVSLMLLAAAAALWVRSYRTGAATWLQSRGGLVVYGFSKPGYLVIAAGHADSMDIDSAWRSGLFHHSYPTELRELGKQQGDSIFNKLGLVATVTEVPIAWHDVPPELIPFSPSKTRNGDAYNTSFIASPI